MARPFAVLLAVALLAAGCGNGDAGGGPADQVPVLETAPETPAPPPESGAASEAPPAAPQEPAGAEDPAEPAAPAPDTTEPRDRDAEVDQAASEPEPEPPAEPQDQDAEVEPPAAAEPPGEAAPQAEAAEPAGDQVTAGTESDAPGAAEGTGPPGPLAFADCGKAYLCATLEVPLDHDDPGGAVVELAVGMIPAGDPAARVGYLLVNPGGPGGGMSGFLDFEAGLSARLLERFDVVGWDPRGVGDSVPSGCWAEARDLHLVDPVPDSPTEETELDGAARALAEACARNLGDAIGHIGTIDTVRDMDAIRRALGVETISYAGFSYGALLGVHYAGMFGDHLRAAVLDGVIDPSLSGFDLLVEQTAGFARTIHEMFAWCRADPDCAVTGDPVEAYDRLLRQVDAEPLRDPTGEVVLDPARMILAVVVGAYDSSLWPLLFTGLAEAIDGDGTMLGLVGEAYIGLVDLGALVSVNCTDGGAATRADLDALAEVLAEVAGDFGRASVAPTLACLYWPVELGTLPSGPVAAPDSPPILVVGNRGDAATPYEWAVSLARQLHSGVLVSFDGTGHTSYGRSECVDRLVDDYLIDLVVPPDGVECPAEG